MPHSTGFGQRRDPRTERPIALGDVVDELLGEELIAPGAAPAATQVPVITGAWVAPRLEKFTDLQTLLLLDPIHDVDEQGWPRVAPSRAGTE